MAIDGKCNCRLNPSAGQVGSVPAEALFRLILVPGPNRATGHVTHSHVTTVNDARSITNYRFGKHIQRFLSASAGSTRNLADVRFLFRFRVSKYQRSQMFRLLTVLGRETKMSLPTQTTKYPAMQHHLLLYSHSNRRCHTQMVNLARAFLADDIPATDDISNSKPGLLSLTQSDYVVPVVPMPRFPFSVAMTNHFRKIHLFATVSHSKEATYNPLKCHQETSRSHAGGQHTQRNWVRTTATFAI